MPKGYPLRNHPARVAAIANGQKHFSTGEPCDRGHVAMRFVKKSSCVECVAEYNRNRYDPQVAAAYARNWRTTEEYRNWRANYKTTRRRQKHSMQSRQRLYGISEDLYHQKLIDQAGLCAICDKQMRGTNEPHLDHNHETGAFRDLLCVSCNRSISILEKPELLGRAQAYLIEHTYVAQSFPFSIPPLLLKQGKF